MSLTATARSIAGSLRNEVDSTPRRVEVAVHLPEGLTHDQVERLTRVAQTCPARRSLEAGFTFDEQLALDLPAASPSGDPDGAGAVAAHNPLGS